MITFALLFPVAVLAVHNQGHVETRTNPPVCPVGKICNPIRFPTIDAFLLAILDVVVKYGAILVVFFFVYAGFQFVTARGDTEKIATARKMFVWVVVGAFVLLGVYVIRAAICGTLTEIGVKGLEC